MSLAQGQDINKVGYFVFLKKYSIKVPSFVKVCVEFEQWGRLLYPLCVDTHHIGYEKTRFQILSMHGLKFNACFLHDL